MALKLVKEVSGINCEYWRVIEVLSNDLNGYTLVKMASYYNQDTRIKSGDNIIGPLIVFSVKGSKLSYEDVYKLIKQPTKEMASIKSITAFAKAEDC